MDTLPKELLIEIFVYLPTTDLLSLSLTCHKFNEIISNNSNLLRNFELQFVADYANNEWIGSRKYTSLFIDGSSGIYFFYILKQIGHEITDLVINCHEFVVAYVKQVLLMCENVKKLTIYNATNDSDPEDFGHPFLKYDLNYFYFQGEIDVFKLFTECTAKSLDVRRDYDDESRDVSGLKKFLKNQKNLKELKLENFDKNSSLFGDEELTSINFKLKALKLKNIDDHASYNFWEFLEHHKETLIHLEVCSVSHDGISPFRKFRNLKTFKMCNMCSDFSAINSVETLYLKDVGGKWSEKFKNVKNLVISQNVEDIPQIENLKLLDNLKISNCSIPTLKIPTVKKLTLKRIELDATKPFEYENGSEIEELKIIKCKNVEWLLEFLIHKTFNLKSLVIKKSILIDDDLKFIEDYRSRVKNLEIIDCYGLTDEDIDDDEDTENEDFSSEEESEGEEEEDEEDQDDNSEDSGSGGEEEESGSGEENVDSGNEERSDQEEEEDDQEEGESSGNESSSSEEEHRTRSQVKRPKNSLRNFKKTLTRSQNQNTTPEDAEHEEHSNEACQPIDSNMEGKTNTMESTSGENKVDSPDDCNQLTSKEPKCSKKSSKNNEKDKN